MLLFILMFALFGTIDFTFAYKCEQIDTSLLPACANVGYNFTANFSNVGQQSYQAYVSSEVTIFADRFNSCSRYAKAFMCARYVPKCSEGVEGPVLPCREVCEQFVDDCDTALKVGGLYNRYVAFCGLLSSEKDHSKQCFKPQGFITQPNRITEQSLPSCDAVTKPACLNNNLSSLGNETRTRLQSSLNRLASVLKSNCSFNLKRLACFTETAPCATNDGHALYTCQSLCQEVRSSCEDEFQKYNIFFPKCTPNYSEVSAGDGLCRLSKWPVPWPSSGSNSRQKRLQCYCNECENNTCRTDGSCLVQRSSDGKYVVVQTCLDRGPNIDFICNTTLPTKQNVHCCEKDFCNDQHITDKPTEIFIEKRDKGRVKKKNAPDITPTPTHDGSDHKKKKITLSGGILASAVVGFLIVILFGLLILQLAVKKLKQNARARRRASAKYVNRSNISSDGKTVTIGDSNKGFEEPKVSQNESVLY